MKISSNLDFELSKAFKLELQAIFRRINPNIKEVELLEFGLEDDIIDQFYKIELVMAIDGEEIYIQKKRTDMDTFHWFNNASMNLKYYRFCKENIIYMIESEKSIRPDEEF